MTPFITNGDFLIRYDWRWVAKNVLDQGVAATQPDLADPNTTAGNVLLSLIVESSEMLMAASAVGARYTETDLRTYGGSLLARIVSDLTMGLILKRRARAVKDEEGLSKPYEEALDYLELLRRGERIFFNVPDVPEAGLPATASMCPRPGIDEALITQEAVRYFGFPAGGCCGPRLPWGWGGWG